MGMTVDGGASSKLQAGDNPAERRQPTRRYEAKRNAIVCSAVAEMNRKGVRGMTLGDVAARLDLVPTGVIYYFRNKEELAAAVFMKGVEAYEALIAAGAGRRPSMSACRPSSTPGSTMRGESPWARPTPCRCSTTCERSTPRL